MKAFRRRKRKREHMDYLWRTIHSLRQEIIDDVLYAIQEEQPRINHKKLIHRGYLIRKYSRRLRILNAFYNRSS